MEEKVTDAVFVIIKEHVTHKQLFLNDKGVLEHAYFILFAKHVELVFSGTDNVITD